MSVEKTWVELVGELNDAKADFDGKDLEEQVARLARTSALNRLNECQRAVDRALVKMRKDAPRDSDWKLSDREGWEVPG